MTHGNALAIRQSLDFPIVDCDGHVLEVMPVFVEYLMLERALGERCP